MTQRTVPTPGGARTPRLAVGLATAAAALAVAGAVVAGGSPGSPSAVTAAVCAHKETGHLRLLQPGPSACLSQETRLDWTIGGEVTDVVAGAGLTAARRDGTVALGVDPGIVQLKVAQACGDGADGSAIAELGGDGSVVCTFPHGIVARLHAGGLVASGPTGLTGCRAAERAGLVPVVHNAASAEVELPPGTYRALPGTGQETVGSALTWRINKSARRDDVLSFYEGSVRAIVQHRDPGSSSWRRATQFLRFASSTGGGGHPDVAHELNVEDEDFGTFTFGFAQRVRLAIQVVATPCTWSQLGGQVAIERIG